MPVADPFPRRRPAGRYDEPSRRPARALAVLIALLFVGLLTAVVWSLYDRFGSDRLALQVRGYEVVSDRLVRVQFDVTPPDGGTAWCLVRARGRDGLEVGAEFVPVRGDGPEVRVEHDLATTDRAVTGEVPRCSTSSPPDDAPTADPVGP